MLTTLIAVDGSENSLRAVDHVCRLASAGLQMDIHLLNVQMPVDSAHVRMFVEAELIDDFYREAGLAVLDPAVRRLAEAGILSKRHLAIGHVAGTILHYASRLAVGQVVMGAHGCSALKHILLGSIASDVVRDIAVPVTLVR